MIAAISASPVFAQSTGTGEAADTSLGRTGRIVRGSSNVYTFSPNDDAQLPGTIQVPVDLAALNLRSIFEAMGEDATLWYQHVLTLSNPFFEGRSPGTRGSAAAVEYIEFYFQQYGLEPAFPGETDQLGDRAMEAWTSYRQAFDFRSPNPSIQVAQAGNAINGEALTEKVDFVVLGNSGSGSVTAPVTFAGYGIENGPDGYSSFDESTDLTGRIALLLRYEPLDENGKSHWVPHRFSPHSGIARKMQNLAERGAAGIVLVNPPGAIEGRTGLESLRNSSRFGEALDIPVVQVTSEIAERMLALGDPQQRDLLTWRKMADSGEVKCVNLDDKLMMAINAKIDRNDRVNAQNVAGVLAGKGDLADKWIIIGAHIDHVGHGQLSGALPGNVGQLHPGADDNASGTAGMLILAKRLSEAYAAADEDANLRSIMFVGFDAEESGLLGSRHFVQNSPIDAEAVTLMVNLDMIGRLRDNTLSVQGADTAENFLEILLPHFENSGLTISLTPGGRGPSDHANFYGAGIPILFPFTGVHDDYHRPSDHGYTVNPVGAIRVIALIQSIVLAIAARPEQLTYRLTTAGGPGRNTGARVRLGIQPGYGAELETGVLVEAVADNTSAAEAGLQAGDIMLSWNGEEITGGQKLFELLRQHEAGDQIKLVILRGDQTLTVDLTLKGR